MKKLVLLSVLTTLLFSCKKDEVVPAPQAEFTYRSSVLSGRMYFTNLSVNANAYKWDFGDGSIVDDINPTHTYISNGTYQVSLIAIGDQWQKSVIVKSVIVTNVK